MYVVMMTHWRSNKITCSMSTHRFCS